MDVTSLTLTAMMIRFDMTRLLAGALLVATTRGLDAQATVPVTRVGDSASAAAIERLIQPVYDAARPMRNVLTRENHVQRPGVVGTELRGFFADGKLGRIVSVSWTTAGRYSAEFYFVTDTLRMIFETHEFFPDSAAVYPSRNFRGYPYWERRLFFGGPAVVFGESKGVNAPHPSAPGDLVALSQRLRALLK